MTDRDYGDVIAFAGDWHGSIPWARQMIDKVAEQDVSLILHVGDFGIWPGNSGARYLYKVNKKLTEREVGIWATPGNHEHWARLNALWANPKRQDQDGNPQPVQVAEHITVLPRGWRWSLPTSTGREVSFVSFGGAASIDYDSRTQGHDWWQQEMIQPEDVDRVTAGGYADVMVAHETPHPPYAVDAVEQTLRSNPEGWPQVALDYSYASRSRLTDALEGVQPRLLVHGHMHLNGERVVRLTGAEHNTAVWSLACDGMEGNLRFLDLTTLGGDQ